uniref:Selenoprotein H n=1 Tax=Leersia perrieri TaxID=77586 RepID=A0A0D9XVP3_9ORYZ
MAAMPPKRKSPAAAAAVGSPRMTRSMAAGKQPAKKEVAAAAPEQKGRKRTKKAEEEVAEKDSSAVVGDGKRIIVEACTQCRQFKIRATKVKEDLESAVPGVSVVINPEKPRRGCLEIREEGGEVFISLLNMPRPFTAMKKLDMDEVIRDVANKIS